MARPYSYLRKSSVRELSTEVAPDTQERETRDLAKRVGIDPEQIVWLSDWDVGGSRKATSRRVGYLALVEAVKAGECSSIMSYSFSRLGRSVSELSGLFDLCADRKVPIRRVADGFDTSQASGRMLANVLASVAQFESEVAGERMKARFETLRQRARDAGEDEREAVRTAPRYGEKDGEDPDLVLRLFRETGSFTRTAKRLNDTEVPSRLGKKWWAASVRIIVERLDPAIAAKPRQKGSKPKGPRVKCIATR